MQFISTQSIAWHLRITRHITFHCIPIYHRDRYLNVSGWITIKRSNASLSSLSVFQSYKYNMVLIVICDTRYTLSSLNGTDEYMMLCPLDISESVIVKHCKAMEAQHSKPVENTRSLITLSSKLAPSKLSKIQMNDMSLTVRWFMQ